MPDVCRCKRDRYVGKRSRFAGLVLAVVAFYGVEKLFGVEGDAVFENEVHVFDFGDIFRGGPEGPSLGRGEVCEGVSSAGLKARSPE